jgi:hypothetical protein
MGLECRRRIVCGSFHVNFPAQVLAWMFEIEKYSVTTYKDLGTFSDYRRFLPQAGRAEQKLKVEV